VRWPRVLSGLFAEAVAKDLIELAKAEQPALEAHETDATNVTCRCGQSWFACACPAELPLVPETEWRGWGIWHMQRSS
jgi:hypothetical protein